MNFPARGTVWAYTGMTVAGLASISANIAHSLLPANPPAGSVVAAGLWPVLLYLAIEILAKHEWPAGPWWITVRIVGLVPVAAVAAVVSYRHMSGLLTAWGEDIITATIGPLAIDGLLIMSTGAVIAAGIDRTLVAPSSPGLEVTRPTDAATEVEVPTPESKPEPRNLESTVTAESPAPLMNATDKKVWDALEAKPLGMSDIRRAANLPLSTTKVAVARLVEKGHLAKTGTLYARREAA